MSRRKLRREVKALDRMVQNIAVTNAIAINRLCAAYGHRWQPFDPPIPGRRARKCGACGQSESGPMVPA